MKKVTKENSKKSNVDVDKLLEMKKKESEALRKMLERLNSRISNKDEKK